MLDKITSVLFYGGLTRDEYRAVRDDLTQRNLGPLSGYSILTAVVLAALGLSDLVTGDGRAPIYFGGCLVEVVMFMLSRTIARRDSVATRVVVALQLLAFFVFAAALGLCFPSNASIVFIVLLVMLPIAFFNRPIYNIIVIFLASSIYLVLGSFIKTPEAFAFDLHNVIPFGVVAFVFSTAASLVKVKGVDDGYKLEHWGGALQEQIRFTEALSREFSNAALVDFEDDTSTTIMLDRRVIAEEDRVSHSGFESLWKNYAEKYIVETQREQILEAVKRERILAALEKSNEYAVTYEVIIDGETHSYRAVLIRLQDEGEWIRRIIIGFQCVDDIIERERERRLVLEEALRAAQEAKFDGLTGIRNRRAFMDETQNLDQRIASGLCDPFAVVVFDVNYMKETNDRFGHIAGDRLLMNTKEAICRTFEHSPVFRIGGDEFIALLYGEDYQNRNELVARFRHEMNFDNTLDGLMRGDTACACGMSVWQPGRDDCFDDVQRRADDFMYQDKHAMKGERLRPPASFGDGGELGVVSYDDVATEASERRQKLIGAFEESLLNGDFYVVYQPKFNATTERIAGAEALVRWNHPELGAISPREFIPLFEENGYTKLIDAEVRRTVERDLRVLKETGGPMISISVNVSKRDLLDPACIASMIAKNAEFENDLGVSLIVEVTETMWADSHEKVRSHLQKLHEAGFVIELDDFGTGYASLVSLADLPIDMIKLDMGLIEDLDKTTPIVRSSIQMAHEMGLKTIAEGVRSAEQLERLCAMGCDFAQGFYFSEPLSRDDFFAFIRR